MLAGSPGNNFAQAGTCRYDSSLGNNLFHKLMFEEIVVLDNKLLLMIYSASGLLTKKFIKLIKQAEDGILDLNKAADTLEVTCSNS